MRLSILTFLLAFASADPHGGKKGGKSGSPSVAAPTEICTPLGVSVSCANSACAAYVPGTCYTITELYQSLIPDMKACYADSLGSTYLEAAILWNERPERGIPAIATLEAIGTIEAKHMQMDIALMFDHWDIIATKIEEILVVEPDDAHALFAKAMYGFEGVLPGVFPDEVPTIIEHLKIVAPNTAKLVDRALADVKMVWQHEFLHPFSAFPVDVCGIGMNSTLLSSLFPGFQCEEIPQVFKPQDLAILVFGAGPGTALDVRIETTRILAERYPHATILATGGALDTNRAEGDLIKEALPQYADRIVVDRSARDTIGNSLAIADYLANNDIGNLLIVSSTWHLPRAAGALRGVLQRNGLYPRTYLVGAGNNVQAPLGTWSQDNADWLETAYGGLGRFRAIEIPMTNRDFARGAGLFTYCDFQALDHQTSQPVTAGKDGKKRKGHGKGGLKGGKK